MNRHPHPEDLAAFSSGLMEESAAQSVEEHLRDCELCRHVLEELPTDPLTAALQLPEADHVSSVPTWTGSLGDADREGRWDQVDDIPPVLAQHPRYRVLEMVGRGGMGLVFKAEHRFLNRLVALKVIRPRLLANPLAVERFRLEVEAAARLSHPNIVTALDADQADDLHFLIMEFVAGANLAECLARQGPLAIADACDVCRQAAHGLQHAHELGMVHRDIKPHNLMRTPSGQVKILDFGLAHLVSARLATGWPEAGGLMGSPDYIAPEQARHAQAVDIRADLYSLGCTLFYLLAGEVPFPAADNAGKVAAHLGQAPRLLSDVRSDVPRELARLVFRLMAKHPEQRVQTPAELVEALTFFVPAGGAPGTHESCRVLMGHADRVSCVAFNPYGFMLATGSHDHSALLWDVNAGQDIADMSRHTGAVRGVAISPDGQTLATAAADGKVRLWNVTRRRKRISLKAHKGPVRAVAFYPDGQTLVSAGDDGWINIWDASDGGLISALGGHTDRVHALCFSRDGRRLASASRDQTVIIWDFASQRQEFSLRDFPRRVAAVALHPSGKLLAVASGDVHLLELDGAQRTRILPVPGGAASCLAYSPDGDAIACGTGNHILLWQLTINEEPRVLEGHHGTVAALAFSPDGRLLASASADRTARVWRIPGA